MEHLWASISYMNVYNIQFLIAAAINYWVTDDPSREYLIKNINFDLRMDSRWVTPTKKLIPFGICFLIIISWIK